MFFWTLLHIRKTATQRGYQFNHKAHTSCSLCKFELNLVNAAPVLELVTYYSTKTLRKFPGVCYLSNCAVKSVKLEKIRGQKY